MGRDWKEKVEKKKERGRGGRRERERNRDREGGKRGERETESLRHVYLGSLNSAWSLVTICIHKRNG